MSVRVFSFLGGGSASTPHGWGGLSAHGAGRVGEALLRVHLLASASAHGEGSPWAGLPAKPHPLPKPEPPNTFSLGLRALMCESGEHALSGCGCVRSWGSAPAAWAPACPPPAVTASPRLSSAPFVRDSVHALRCPVSGEVWGHLQEGRRDGHSQVHTAGDPGAEEGAAARRVVQGR